MEMCQKHFTQYKSADISPPVVSFLEPLHFYFYSPFLYCIYIIWGTKYSSVVLHCFPLRGRCLRNISTCKFHVHSNLWFSHLLTSDSHLKGQKNGNTLTRMSFIYISGVMSEVIYWELWILFEIHLLFPLAHISHWKKSNWTLFVKPFHFYKDNICIFQLSSCGKSNNI